MDYTTMPLMTQLSTIQADVAAVSTLKSMAELWGKAATELKKASGDFQQATNQLEPNWTDASGTDFVGSSRESNKTIDTWAQNIANSQAQSKIDQVAGEIPGTAAAVQKVVDQYKAALATAAILGISPQELELLFRPIAGAEMNKLAGTYQQATDAVSKARGGSWQGLSSDHPGAQSVDDVQGRNIDVPVGPQGTGLGGTEDGAGGALPGAGTDGTDAEGGLGVLPGPGQDPTLSGGLGGAPVAPPTLPPVAPPIAPPVAPALPVGGMSPMMPGGFGGRGGGGGGGGPRVPGVRLGGGGPVGAQPVNSPAAPVPASAPTVTALTSTPTTGSATAGVPPMMPPMGAGMGMGAGGGGGIPGPGLARRKHRDGDDEEPPTPGLPAGLSGKAGLPEAFRFASAQRTETDAPGTVQLIDEDLWHEETAKAPVRSAAR